MQIYIFEILYLLLNIYIWFIRDMAKQEMNEYKLDMFQHNYRYGTINFKIKMTFREKSFKETKLPFQIDAFINNMDFQVLHGVNNIQLDFKKQKQIGTQKGIYSHRKEQNHYRIYK